ncbi:MAG: serine/threonine protein phosphatase [Legionellales bacterium]|nr:serine/threonine protein phosphatase [Legionellales bacterium]|tara:strand:- start:700 stop:1116 length:417 start_codon:yes stop_codon:yes gene_type:complete
MSEDMLSEIRFPAKAERLCEVRALVKKRAKEVGCCSEVTDELVIAVNEACMNVIQHAYKGDESGEVLLQIISDDVKIHFRIEDYANPIDLDSVEPRDLDDLRPGGLGTHFINEIMDECDRGYLEGENGNYLEMTKKIS